MLSTSVRDASAYASSRMARIARVTAAWMSDGKLMFGRATRKESEPRPEMRLCDARLGRHVELLHERGAVVRQRSQEVFNGLVGAGGIEPLRNGLVIQQKADHARVVGVLLRRFPETLRPSESRFPFR